MVLPIWFSRSSALALAAVLCLATGDGRAGDVPPVAVRPAVALRFQITAPVYRGLLQDLQCQQTCKQLQAQLEDTLRVILQRRFAFLHWKAGGPPPVDTALFQLIQTGASLVGNPVLELTIKGRDGDGIQPLPLEFEKWAEASQRAGTGAKAMREAWIKKADSILAEKGSGAVTELLGRVPVNALVTIDPTSLRAHVALHRDTINAAATPWPEFLVRTEVRESTPFETVDTAGMVLGGCRAHAREGYVCNVLRLIPSDPAAPAQDPGVVLRRAQIKVVSVHLKQYWARTVVTAPGGALPPGGTP